MPPPAARQPSLSPSRPESQFETIYQSAVQSFIRRDHNRTQASLKRLLDLCNRLPTLINSPPWYNLSLTSEPRTNDEYMIKSLKLVISSYASLYADPPFNVASLPPELRTLLKPSPPDVLLRHIQNICDITYFRSTPSPIDLLPPALISTLLMASIKLQPPEPSLHFAHNLAETWLSILPDSFVESISAPPSVYANGNGQTPSAEDRKRVESAREGYLKVVELFVGEILGREGEFEMARAILDGEIVMPSKRKENVYRHLRAIESKSRSNPSSPANSMTLPSQNSSGILPPFPAESPTHTGNKSTKSRSSRSSSTSSSSSERTARPGVTSQIGLENRLTSLQPIINKVDGSQNSTSNGNGRKGKNRAIAEYTDREDTVQSPSLDGDNGSSAAPFLRKIWVNTPDPSRSIDNTRPSVTKVANVFETVLTSYLPQSISSRLVSMIRNDWFLSAVKFPLPMIILIMAFLTLRRKIAGRRAAKTGTPAVVAGTGILAERAVADVRERLRRVRGRGFGEWIGWVLKWWMEKFAGVWKLGTTITYV